LEPLLVRVLSLLYGYYPYYMGTIPTNHGWDNFFEVIE
jgi:hypothetical protein